MNNELIFEYIKEYVDKPINCVYLWNDEDDELYEKVINRLISINNQEVNDWLWNALVIKEKEYDIASSSLNEAAKEFVSSFVNAKNNWLSKSATINRSNIHSNILININSEIVGERIILKPCSIKNDNDLYLYHVENDGDFITYLTPNSKNDSPKRVWINTCLPFAFYIHLKDTDEEIGVASLYDFELNHNRVLKIADVHYYIYKEFRHKGYAYEATKLLMDAFFNKKLKNYVTTNKQFIMEERICEPLCLKINPNAKNQASNALAKKLGFVFEGTIHYYKMMDDEPQDENHYYLDTKMYFEKNS